MKIAFAAAGLVGLGLSILPAYAAMPTSSAISKYRITAEEQTACGMDAVELCSSAYPDEDKMLGCMKVNRLHLSAACRPIFDEGMRRRHLN